MARLWRTQRRLIQKEVSNGNSLTSCHSIMQDSLAESLREFDKQPGAAPSIFYPHLMKITFFEMVGKSLFRRPGLKRKISASSAKRSRPSGSSWFVKLFSPT